MDENSEILSRMSLVTPELYFLIQKFLSNSPLKRTLEVLNEELQEHKILPKRIDWEGNEHERTINDLYRQYPHISPDHLLQICARVGLILDKEYSPCVKGVVSLLGAGRQSLLRGKDVQRSSKNLRFYAGRLHQKPIVDPPFTNYTHNIVYVLAGREMSGPTTRKLILSPSHYSQVQLQRQTLGHMSAVYCLLFDHSGRYIITGADDLLIKLWSSISGRLLATFRGASSEITDIAINPENTLLAAGSMDKVLRVWNLQSGAPIASLTIHTGSITSVKFCPSAHWGVRYLITTSTDGSVAFWIYSHDSNNKTNFMSKPIQYQERMRPGQAQMICSSFSPGGTFLATGSADHHVRVYYMAGDEGPHRILETEAHSDRVDSIQWAHSGLWFLSGSKDGTANIWHFECQQWCSQKLHMATKLDSKGEIDDGRKLKVTMVAWDCTDTWVITAVSDHCLKVWKAVNGELVKEIRGHNDEIYVLESHPHDPHLVLSAGHDGQLIVSNIITGEIITHFMNNIEGQGYGAIFDVKWSPDGTMIAASDSHGHILMFGFGTGNPQLNMLPKELFFHTDYRPLVRDNNHLVLDEQTQVPPHLMPPPFLVDIDGNPYPPVLQRLVPGRENCKAEQLVPNIVVGTGGNQEVIEGLPEEQPRSDIDRMIAALAQRQYGENANENETNRSDTSHSAARVNVRRNGDIEVIRHTTGNWQRDPNLKWVKNILMQPLKESQLQRSLDEIESMRVIEISDYQREMRHRPVMISTATVTAPKSGSKRRRNRNRQSAYHTRSARAEEGEPVTVNESSNSCDSSVHEEDLLSSESSTEASETSGYSDWVADHGVNLEPPKRSKRRPNRCVVSQSEHDEHDEDEDNKQETPVAKVVKIPKLVQGEVPDIYKPLEWLAETKPRKAPYYPQMGDEIVYFRQGHQLYVDAVKAKKVYEVNSKDLPWTKTELKDIEFVKVVGIKYEIRPPRLCCLKLSLLDSEYKLTGNVFTIKYHDMADVLDFFVLKQMYEVSMSRNWNTGDKFRCMIEDGWWTGEIVSKSPLNEEYPDSPFMCYEVRWDNGEFERMCPWDLEPVNEDRLPENVGEAVPVLQEEVQNILYQPTANEWPQGDRDGTCRRIIAGLDKVMELAIAEPFLAPVDLSYYPTYAFIVEYPIDLSTIKARFENHFYRRITSAQFDIRYLATNAEKFNEPHSVIVKHARIITELCLRIIKGSSDDIDVAAIYHQLVDTYESSDSEVDIDISQPGPSTSRPSRTLPCRYLRSAKDWRKEAKALLDAIWRTEDSAPFRAPVDRLKHPDYYQVIDTPMDLGSIREDLLGGNYESPQDFCKDMRLVFTNSKNYNTNKRSRIYSMTLRLSAMFEAHISKIIYNWKIAKRREMQNKNWKRSTRNANNLKETRDVKKPKTKKVRTKYFNEFKNSNKIDDLSSSDDKNNESDSSSDEDTASKNTKSDSEESYKPSKSRRKADKSNKNKSDSDESNKPCSSKRRNQTPDYGEKVNFKKAVLKNKSDSEDSYRPNVSNRKSVRNKSDSEESYKPTVSKRNKTYLNGKTHESEKSDSDDIYKPSVSRKRKVCYNGRNKFTKSDSEESYKPSSSKRRKLNENKQSYRDSKSDSEDSYRPRRNKRHQVNHRRNSDVSKSDDDDDEENYKPNRRKTRNHIIDDNSESEESYRPDLSKNEINEEDSTSEFSESEDDDDSDNQPLSVHVKVNNRQRPRRKCNKIRVSSDGSEVNIPVRTRKLKRKTYFEGSDSDDNKTVHRNGANTLNSLRAVTVSSRGRIRRLTPRAQAFLEQ